MDVNDVRTAITVATFLCFLGICWWAYRGGNRARFEQDALIPFQTDETNVGEPGSEKNDE